MKKTVLPFAMGIATTHEMPYLSEFLTVQVQNNIVVAWFLVYPDGSKKLVPRKFKLYSSGIEIESNDRYLGTVQAKGPLSAAGALHLFEDVEGLNKKQGGMG